VQAGAGPAARLELLPQRWIDDHGAPIALTGLRGHRIVLTMAYANCHQICPMTMQRLKALQHGFDARGEQVEVVVVGFDPERDDAAAWHRYRIQHRLTRPNWHFLSGSVDDTVRIAKQLGIELWKYDEHVMHDSRVLLFASDGTYSAELTDDASAIPTVTPSQNHP